MGCTTSGTSKTTVPINNSLMHLLQTGQNELIMKKVEQEGPELMKIRLNFLGDTIAHYACFRNNYQLVELLKKLGADFSIPNNNGMTPADLTEDPEILKLIGAKQKTISRTASTEEAANMIRKTQQRISNMKQQTKYSVLVHKADQSGNINQQIKKTNESRQALIHSIDQYEKPNEESRKRSVKQSMLTQIAKTNLESKIPVS